MTNPWVQDVTPDDPVQAVGWWADTLKVQRSSASVGSASGTNTVTFDHEVLADREHLVYFLACRGVFSGSYSWSLSGVPGIQYQAYRGINSAETHGFIAYFTAYNVPQGMHTAIATVTAQPGDTFSQIHAGAVGFSGASDVEGFYWQRGTGRTDFSDLSKYPQGGMLISGIVGQNPLPVINSDAGPVTELSSPDGRFKLLTVDTNGLDIAFSQNYSGEWVEISVGVEP
ncbi:hypothetical protein [Mycolicibacter algericus]|uniref:Uncharacterized protein n=2 Tax=Mycolicibacter algericus TaxID=1288388 RepID=A0A7I9Y403_MYCAL|nr:hypothetical protein [Mycolicibacter algericus]OQZ94308.1 hypothetical protein BST10_18720 [Mycolicibacter algericus DSM 45454]GFG83396.1 hypothetical protein MALGJ_00720 [Mycolicibacter algericus]